ncbi:ACR protein [Corynebacterium phocae]|nr:ACR protein [Corynebacterium phocae]
MNIVLHLPKENPAPRTALLEAAARAVVAACLDPRAGAATTTAYVRGFDEWYGHRIRKVARRARNKAWEDVQAIPGVTVAGLARAFVPSPVDAVHPLIAKLQINGTDVPSDCPPPPPDGNPVIYVDSSLNMTAGKAAAQVGHGSMLLAARMPWPWVKRWAEQEFPLSVREVEHAVFAQACGHPDAVVVRDAGFTEVAPDSVTVVAVP